MKKKRFYETKWRSQGKFVACIPVCQFGASSMRAEGSLTVSSCVAGRNNGWKIRTALSRVLWNGSLMNPQAVLLQKYLIATLLSAAVASAAPPAADPDAPPPQTDHSPKPTRSFRRNNSSTSHIPSVPRRRCGPASARQPIRPLQIRKQGGPIRSRATGFVHPCIRWWGSMAHILTHRRISTPPA